jgi:signal peptidase II
MNLLQGRYRPLLAVTPAFVVLDQWTKYLVDHRMLLHQSVPILPGWFELTYVRNRGAVFGFLSGVDSWWRLPFFLTFSTVAVVLLAIFYIRSRPDQGLLRLSLALILAGAIGNVIDRLRFGYVIDFLDVHWRHHHWPAFNIADSAISVGICLMLLEAFLEGRREKRAAADDPGGTA